MLKPTDKLVSGGISERNAEIILRIFEKHLPAGVHGKIYLFGSRASGKQCQFSDVDLLLDFDRPLNTRELGLLKEMFEESALPYHVDLVCVPDLFEPYREKIEQEKILIITVNN